MRSKDVSSWPLASAPVLELRSTQRLGRPQVFMKNTRPAEASKKSLKRPSSDSDSEPGPSGLNKRSPPKWLKSNSVRVEEYSVTKTEGLTSPSSDSDPEPGPSGLNKDRPPTRLKSKSPKEEDNTFNETQDWRSCLEFSQRWSPELWRPQRLDTDSVTDPELSTWGRVSNTTRKFARILSRKRKSTDACKNESRPPKLRSSRSSGEETEIQVFTRWESCPELIEMDREGPLSPKSWEPQRPVQEAPKRKPDNTSEDGTNPPTESHSPREENETRTSPDKVISKKYKVHEYVGGGAFGRVYAGIRIADKFPKGPNGRRRIPIEVHMIQHLGAGPNSVDSDVTPRLLNWYNMGGTVVIVLERPRHCMDLHKYLERKESHTLDEEEARVLFRQLVHAGAELEAKGVFHRDIKPDNILIESGLKGPRARFIDFGCAIHCTPERKFTVQPGAIAYSCPEWFRRIPYTVGPTTVWQLGLILYIMLFNKKPVVKKKTLGSWSKVPIPNSVSQECRDALGGCLEKDPGDRFSLEELKKHPCPVTTISVNMSLKRAC
uniref:Serine/threonine-protein kinase 1 n=1 Tax=Knipowitschia caucasica TaxID=637954 RepID=A0AAV2JWL0_KNICA